MDNGSAMTVDFVPVKPFVEATLVNRRFPWRGVLALVILIGGSAGIYMAALVALRGVLTGDV